METSLNLLLLFSFLTVEWLKGNKVIVLPPSRMIGPLYPNSHKQVLISAQWGGPTRTHTHIKDHIVSTLSFKSLSRYKICMHLLLTTAVCVHEKASGY